MEDTMDRLDKQLDSFDPKQRSAALAELMNTSQGGQVAVGKFVNIHIHTFFGYNAYGYSPSKAAWLAHKHGLAVAGIIDFDVLDGLNEFLDAAKLTNIKSCAGLETRVFVPEYASKEINSPGEPGIAYHIGIGFPRVPDQQHLRQFQQGMQRMSRQRNVELTQRVNTFLDPVVIDYDKDVLPLTPGGNATERHICQAYAIKALNMFKDTVCQFWMQKLGCSAESIDLPHGPKLLGEIRKKTMKKGSVGYVLPDKGSFPAMADVNKFIIEAGGIPTLCWHDGMSDAELEEEKLLEVAMSTGVAAFSVIPNPAYTPRDPKKKLENLYKVIELVERVGLPVVSGTEMNNYGQAFVDDFDSKELAPLAAVMLKGAHIIYAHSVMQRQAAMGYLSTWAAATFKDTHAKNGFFEKLGTVLNPRNESRLSNLSPASKPEEILAKLS